MLYQLQHYYSSGFRALGLQLCYYSSFLTIFKRNHSLGLFSIAFSLLKRPKCSLLPQIASNGRYPQPADAGRVPCRPWSKDQPSCIKQVPSLLQTLWTLPGAPSSALISSALGPLMPFASAPGVSRSLRLPSLTSTCTMTPLHEVGGRAQFGRPVYAACGDLRAPLTRGNARPSRKLLHPRPPPVAAHFLRAPAAI